MVEALRPSRGGFLRPFGTAIFIRDFLAGEGEKYDSWKIDPAVGAPQEDIHAAYKGALIQAIAEDEAAKDAEVAISAGRPLTPGQVEERRDYYLSRIPYKSTRMRYHSFLVYFGMLKRLGWVEATGETETSTVQEDMALRPGERQRATGQPRIYYRLTDRGRKASTAELSDPITALYHYPREVRSARRKGYFVRKR